MSSSPRLELRLWACQGIQSQPDVVDVVHAIGELGLFPGVGAWTHDGQTPSPVADIAAHLDGLHTTTTAGRRATRGGRIGESEEAEGWLTAVVNHEHPQAYSSLSVTRRGEGMWNLLLMIGCSPRDKAGLSDEEFSTWAASLLERLAGALYTGIRPTLCSITGRSADGSELTRAVLRRQLIVGWRTWYGPAYVETFGRESLLRLPDHAESLENGGVAHALGAPPQRLVAGDLSMYDSVWPYLDGRGIRPAWPVARRGRKRLNDEAARALGEFSRDLQELLKFAIVLEGNQRVKVLDLDWSALAGGGLRELKQELVLSAVQNAAERELREYPDARIRFEFGQGAPKELQRLVDQLSHSNPRLSYVVLPSQN
jgi:hypothetical protein